MILKGDCIEVMQAMKPNSVDAVICDPPYGLEFMGKEWDRLMRKDRKVAYPSCRSGHGPDAYQAGIEMQLWHTHWLTEAYRVLKPGASMLVMGGTRTFHRLMVAIEDSGFIIKDCLMWLYGSGFPKAQDLGKMIDKRGGRIGHNIIAIKRIIREQFKKSKFTLKEFNQLCKFEASGYLRESSTWETVLPTNEKWKIIKQVLNFSNQFDNIFEEAEREILGIQYKRTKQNWMPTSKDNNTYISNPSTPLAKHWDGFKIGGIKPAYEPIVWAVKPPEGSYVDNVLKWGIGATNVGECRISGQPHHNEKGRPSGEKSFIGKGEASSTPARGRFPSNVILTHHPECEQVGVKRVKGGMHGKASGGFNPTGKTATYGKGDSGFDASGGYKEETIENWNCHPDCPVKILDEQSIKGGVHGAGYKTDGEHCKGKNPGFRKEKNAFQYGDEHPRFGDSGGASRFFYCAKASRSERGKDNKHPTVKPVKLFEYLIKLVTREGQIILDPFLGSGTTLIAAHNTGRKCIGIEREEEYIEIAKKRIEYWKKQPRQLELNK